VSPTRRLQAALLALTAIILAGSLGFVLLGDDPLDAVYRTITTITTVGFREVGPTDTAGKVFTIVLVLTGVGTAFYTMGVLLETLVEGQLRDVVGRRRMERKIEGLQNHTVICGWGRVGRTIAQYVHGGGQEVVVIDVDATRLASCPYPNIVGDATEDEVLEQAGVRRARAVVAACDLDASNLFVVVSCRALQPDLFIVARARGDANEQKLLNAGADRVVNPQHIGGARIAAFLVQPHVAEFLDVVMHDGSLEFRLAEIPIVPGCPIDGLSLRDAQIRDRTGALVLAIRDADGRFATNPAPETPLQHGHVMIAVGTEAQINGLTALVGAGG
jgi:voltage-gated potassium channel